MTRETVRAEIIEEGLRQDILWLLITVYSYLTRAQFKGLSQMSREQFAVDAILLDSAARDIVARLTALDDDTRHNRSFQTLFAAMKREGLDARRAKELDSKVKAYRKTVNELKVSHRNHYIAHVNTNAVITGRVRQDGVNSAVATGHRQAAFDVMCKGWISSSIMV